MKARVTKMWASPRLRLAALDLICTGGAVALWSGSSGHAGPLPLMLALVPHGARVRAKRPVWKGTVFDVPLALFLLTALAGVWLATDRAAAWAKWWLIVAALLTFLALARQPARNVWPVVSGLGFLSVAAAIYFLFTHDWQAYPAKFDGLEMLAGSWMAIRPELGLPALHPNVMASLVALLSPYLVATAGRARRLHKRWLWRAAIVVLAISGVTLILAASRGAILALGAALLVWLLWQAGVKVGAELDVPPLAISTLLALTILLLVSLVVNAVGGPIAYFDQLPGPASASDRALLMQETAALVADYPLIGGGLASFPGLYSRYILNIPYFMLPNGHNIFLDVWLEQGILGLLALLTIVGGSFWLLAQGGRKQAAEPDSFRPVRWAIASSMLVILVHGLVEDTVYGSVTLPALFTGPGLVVALSRPLPRVAWSRILPVGAAAVAVLLALPAMRALGQANWGAVHMAQIELHGWPSGEWDNGRYASALAPAESHFEQALSLDPGNRTAHYRLGLIAMTRRDYDAAVPHLERAYALGRNHNGIKKALAYSYLWSGDLRAAMPLLAEIPGSHREVETYAHWWRTRGYLELSELAREAARQLNP